MIPILFVANMYPSTDYSDPSGIYSTDPQVAKALATMSDEEAKALIGGLYNTDDPAVVQEIFTEALDSANESSVIIPLNYRNEYAVFNSDVIESYTFNSIPNHVDVAADPVEVKNAPKTITANFSSWSGRKRENLNNITNATAKRLQLANIALKRRCAIGFDIIYGGLS